MIGDQWLRELRIRTAPTSEEAVFANVLPQAFADPPRRRDKAWSGHPLANVVLAGIPAASAFQKSLAATSYARHFPCSTRLSYGQRIEILSPAGFEPATHVVPSAFAAFHFYLQIFGRGDEDLEGRFPAL